MSETTTKQPYKLRVRAGWLKRHRPAQFRDHYSIVHMGTRGIPIEIERINQLTPEEREKEIDELIERRAQARAAKEAASEYVDTTDKTGLDA